MPQISSMTCKVFLGSQHHCYWSPPNCSVHLYCHTPERGRAALQVKDAQSGAPGQAALTPLALVIVHLYVESQDAEVPKRNHESLMTL